MPRLGKSLLVFIVTLILTGVFFSIGKDKVAAASCNHYIDSAGGSDSNSGTSELPWKSLTPVNSHTIVDLGIVIDNYGL